MTIDSATMTFDEYYNRTFLGGFRNDLHRVMAALPMSSSHAPEMAVQPRSLSGLNPVVRDWSTERRMLFASGLYLSVLADQVCYTHFKTSYFRFRKLTEYPKLLGDCPGGCGRNIEPSTVFVAIGNPVGSFASMFDVPLSTLPADVFTTMRREIVSFVETHLPEIEPEAFWRKFNDNIPLAFRLHYHATH